MLFYVLFVLCRTLYCLCVNVSPLYYCHRVATQLQLTNISYTWINGNEIPGYAYVCSSVLGMSLSPQRTDSQLLWRIPSTVLPYTYANLQLVSILCHMPNFFKIGHSTLIYLARRVAAPIENFIAWRHFISKAVQQTYNDVAFRRLGQIVTMAATNGTHEFIFKKSGFSYFPLFGSKN